MNAHIITKKMVETQASLDTSTVMSTLWEIQSVLSLQNMNSTGVIMIQLLVSTKIAFHSSNYYKIRFESMINVTLSGQYKFKLTSSGKSTFTFNYK